MTSFMLALSLLFSLLRVESGWGQLVNTYLFSTNNTGTLINPTYTAILNSGNDDAVSALQSIGFNFVYEGVTYTQVSANSNGLVRLGSALVTSAYANSISSTLNNPKLMPLWDDLSTGSDGNVRMGVSGSAPNRICVLDFRLRNNSSTSSGWNIRFQVRLYETTNLVEFFYVGTGNTVGTATCGINGASQNNFQSVTTTSHLVSTSTANNSNTAWPGAGRVYAWTPPPYLSSFSPSSVCVGGSITITGTNFSSSTVTGVNVNGVPVSSYTVVNSTTITAVTTTTQASGVVAVTFAGGSSSSSSSLTMNSLPTITSSGSVNAVCTSSSAQTSTFSYSASTNSPTSYSIDWNATANNAGLADVATTSHSFLSGGNSFSVPIGANVAPGIYNGTLSFTNANGCIGTSSINITITALPTLASVSQQSSLCYTQNVYTNASIQLSGLLFNTAQTATYNINGGTSQTIAFTSSASGTATLSVPVVLANNGQTLSITSINCANFTSNNSCVISVIQAPSAPNVLPLTQTVNVGASATFTGTRSASANTMTWWTAVSGGTEIDPDGPALSVDSVFNSYDAVVLPSASIDFCTPGLINASTTTYKYYVQQYDGTCPSARTLVQVFTNPLVSSSSLDNLICQNGSSVTLTANITLGSGAIQWSQATTATTQANPPNPATYTYLPILSATNQLYTASNLSQSTIYQLNSSSILPLGCLTMGTGIDDTTQITVYPSLDFTPYANPSSICIGGSTSLIPNTPSANFTASCITPNTILSTPPPNAVTLVTGGIIQPLPSGVTVNGTSLDDNFWSNVPIGFSYNFFGQNASTVFIGSNGTVVVGVSGAAGSTQYNFTGGFPNTANPASTIAVSARDLHMAHGSVRYWTEGFAPTRRFIVQYDSLRTFSTCTSYGYQKAEAVFYETSGIIDIRVIAATNGSGGTTCSTNSVKKYIGLQDPTKIIGATAPNCNSSNVTLVQNYWNGINQEIFPNSPKAWRFAPPANYNIQWSIGSGNNLTTLVTIPYSTGGNTASNYYYQTLPAQSSNSGPVTYTVAATNTNTNCPSKQAVQVTVNPTPSAPNVTSTTQCGPGVPTASLSTGNGISSPAFTWYTQTPVNTNNLLSSTTYYSNNFSSTIGTGVLNGDAVLDAGSIRLTQNANGLFGGFSIPASGFNADQFNMKFDIQAVQVGADGISYSFADDADATSTAVSAEHGSGSKLIVSFDEYGTAGANGSPGVRLIYGGAVSDPPEVGGNVLAFSSQTPWVGSASLVPIIVDINNQGQLTLKVNGTNLFTNVQLPASYLSANKGSWKHVFKARTGGVSSEHRIDNVILSQSTAASTYYQSVSATTTYYVTESVLGCPSAAVPVTVTVNPLPATLTPSTPAPYCQGDPAAPLTTTGVTGSNPLNWYLGSLSATPSTIAPTPVTSVAGTTNYLVTQTSTANGCASTPATISIVVNATPSAPAYSSTYSTGTITQCQGTAPISIANAVVASANGTLYYYTVPTGGTALSATPSSTPSVAGTTTYYVSQVISGCEGPRTVVTSVVNPSLTASVAISASSTTVCPNGSITYNAVPTNGGPAPTYVWFVNATQVGTGATYTQTLPVSGDAIYATMVSNEPSCLFSQNATSATITLNNSSVTPSVSIIQNTGTTICANSSVTFSVANALNMGASPTYAWKVNGTTVGTAATYTTTTLTNNDVVTLTMTSSLPSNCLTGGIAAANAAGITMTVTPITAITAQPANASVCLGGAQSLAVSAIGTGTITYQWQSAATTAGPFTNISFASNTSAQSATLSIPSVAGQLSYQLVATSSCGNATSSIATISINQATGITAQPQAVVACDGTTATFNVTAVGTGTISYQWRFNGSPITGATSASYSIPAVAAANAGQYSVVVSATCGSVTSANAQLTVNPLTTISSQPVSASICDSTLLSLSVTASGTAPISYQWQLNGSPISGATSALYSDAIATVAESGSYTVLVSGGCSNLLSSAATVVVSPNTWITAQPVSYTGCALNPTSLSVTGLGANLQYQWSLGSNPSAPITGATSATYNLSNPQTSNSGSYTVTMTGTCGAQTSNIALVTINPVPSAGTITGGNSGVCVGSTINLTNLASGGVWTSSNPLMGSISSTGVLTGVSAGTITVTYTVTNSFGCVSTATKVIQVKGLPTALIQTPLATSICQGEAMNLQSSAAVSYAWSNGATTQNIAVNSSATGTVNYTVTVTGTNACTATSAPLAITVIPVPTIAAINGTGNYPNFCLGNTSNLTNATANGIWSSSNTNVLTVNPLSGAANTLTIGTATVSYYVANIPGCLNPNPGTATATITVSTPPAAFITPSGSTTFCQGGSVTLTAPSGVGYNYLWSNGATTQSITATTSGSYSLTVTATGGCSVTSLPTTVTVLPIPTATIYPTGAINICTGTNVTLSTGSAVSYVWSNGAITPTVSVNTSGTYSVTLTGTNGCTVTSAVSTVTVTPVPSAVITANGPTNICDGGSVGLSVPTAGSYLWSNGATTQGISATSTGNYSVTATNGICSATSTPVYVNFNPVPSSTVTASGPTTFCQGGNVTLTAATGNSFTYLWSNGATTQSITVAASGTYSVTVSNSFNCSSTSTPISVVVNALPTASITAGGSTTICSGNTISLTAATANAYLWSTGATTQTISASTSGNYTVQAISAAGCTANSAATAITVLPSPTAVITQASGTTFCQGGSVVINSTPASAYLWSNSETTQAISATTTGVYSVLVTAANGCTAISNTINVNVLPTPTATIYPGTNVNICAGSTVTLSTGTAASYVWSNGAITPTITVSANGTHSVTLTGSNGCTATSALTTVTVNPIPVAAITAAGTTNICSGTSVNLTATSAGSYLWSNGATTQTIAASLAGAYTVTVTTAGCSATSASTTVNVNQSPTANVTASGPTSFCQGGSVSFTANAGNGYSYLWSNGATTASISTSTSGNNSVTVTNLIGCSTTSAVNAVVVNPIPVATITAGGSTTICSGSPVSLSAPAGANYLWNTGSTAQSINAATAGNYTVVVTSTAGCSATSAPTTITVNALPSAAISSNGSTTFCQGGTVGLSANSGMTSYLWSNGDTGQSIAAANSGGYTVVVTDANGCSATSNLINVNVNPAPTATIFPGTNVTICSGSSVTLSTNSAVSYNWSTGAITPTIQVNTPGNYSVTLTGSNGCSATSPLTIVAVTTTPTAAITSSGPTTICQGDNVSLSAPAAANSYLWNTGATTQTITVSLVGSYFVTVGSNGCSATSPSTFVSYNPVPSAAVTASGPTTFCLGNSVSFSAPAGNGNSYLWNTGATTQSVSTSTPGTFSVTVTNGYGCSASSAVNTVLVNPLPVVTPITGTSSICESTQGQVSNVMTGGVYASSNLGVASIGQLNGQITGLTAGTTTISYLYTDNNGCSNTVTYPVTIIAAPVATITAGGPTTFCQGGSVTLTASSGTAYAWSNGATTASITVSASGSYSVSVTGANGCSATSQATTVNVLTPSPVSAINGANSVCVNSATSFTNATSGGTWSTSNPLIATVSSSGNVTGVSAGSATITYAINSTNGCQNAATKVVNVNAVPATALTASGATTFCQGSNVSLTASTGSTYLWSTGATTSSITASTSGTYNVTVTNANGCSSVSTNQLITVNANPTASISTNGSTNLCTGGSIVLMATPSSSYLWNTGATTSSITATTAGSYSVTVTNANGCSATSTATSVVVNASPSATVTASGPTTICSGSNVVLSATSVAGNTYQWSNNGVLISGATSASYTATTSGTYAVTVTNASGCSATSTTTPVSVVLATAATITPSGSTSLCNGSSVVLAANAGSSYLWSTGATTQSITVNTAANYSVTVTNALGCSATSTVLPVVVNAAPIATITAGGPTTFCQGGNVVLTASSGASYVWSNGATTASITASTPGSYSVLITNASGCAATAAATAVTVNAAPNAAITAAGSTTFCSGGSVTLTASAGASYLWSTGATTASISVNTAGARTVTVTNAAGCSSTSAATTVVVNATPTASITAGGSTTICSGSSVTLTASAGSSYAWSNGATTASIVANTTGNYTVTVFNANGCSAISTPTIVTVNNPSVANISTSGSTNFCQGGSVVLTATAASTYAWSTGATTQAITVSASGNYSVTLTNASGCTSTSPVTAVTANALPTATITAGGATTFCQGGSVTLTASPATSYVWSNGATSASITVSTAGSYTVQVANNAGCVSTSAATVVSVNALPTATITAGGPLNICAGSSVVLTASAGSTYLWSTGATTPSITVNTAGSRTVTVTNAAGCSSTSAVTTVVVNALPTPTVSVIGSTTLCQGATVTLTTANGTGLTYQWKNNGTNIAGANGASYVANAAGIYTVQVTNAAGCSGTSTASTVVVNALPVASISNSGSNTICAGSSVNLTASTGTAYSWSNGATTASIAVNATGSYTVSITNAAGCTSSASTAITVVTPTAASIYGERTNVLLCGSKRNFDGESRCFICVEHRSNNCIDYCFNNK
jgi:large repetitive protein